MNMYTYIINLKSRVDRYEHIVNEVQKIPILQYQVVDAIVDETKTCFASHIKCIRLAKENQLPYVLILEDDAMFTSNCIDILNVALNQLQQLNWDMFYLGANLNAPAYSVNDHILKLTGAYTTHAYMVHERFYDTILNLTLDYEIDVCYSKLMSNNNIFMCDPIIAYQLPSHSDLQHAFKDYNEHIRNNYLRFKI
jgi:GR25 family glycosyltransferase involved in LPS biosynthesis